MKLIMESWRHFEEEAEAEDRLFNELKDLCLSFRAGTLITEDVEQKQFLVELDRLYTLYEQEGMTRRQFIQRGAAAVAAAGALGTGLVKGKDAFSRFDDDEMIDLEHIFKQGIAEFRRDIFRVLPAPLAAVLLHLGGTTGIIDVPSGGIKRALYYSALAKEKGMGPRTRKGRLHYGHYYAGQKLDPKYKDNPSGVYLGKSAGVPSVGGKEAIISSNPYVQLSITFGNAGYTGNAKEGYKIKDIYDFNNGREASRDIFSAADRAGAFKFMKRKLIGSKKDPVRAAEELMKWREAVAGYEGYPIQVETGRPDLTMLQRIQGLFGSKKA
jgi:hypothetical protein